MSGLLTWFLLSFSTILALIFWHLKNSYDYFKAAGIPTINPLHAFIGIKNIIKVKKPFATELAKAYNAFEPYAIFGVYSLFNRSIMIRDPELLKRILIKDFSNFQNHGTPVAKHVEPLSIHLFNLEGKKITS